MLCKYLLVILVSLCYSCFSNLSVFLTWTFAGTFLLLPYSPASILQSEWLFPSGKSGHSIAHCKVLWFFPSAHKIISRLLSLDYLTLCNFASVYFSNSSLAIFQDNHQVMPNYPQFPKYEFSYIPLDMLFLLPGPCGTAFVYLANSRSSWETWLPSHFPSFEFLFFRVSITS